MLTKLSFKNFKAWKDSGEIRLAPLTVFFGTNSAGKSSITQLLLMLKQTTESSDRQRALHLGNAQSLVDLGTYDEVVHNHDVKQALEFSFEWSLGDELVVQDPLNQAEFPGDVIRFSANLTSDERHQPAVESLRYDMVSEGEISLSVGMRRQPKKTKAEFEISYSGYNLTRNPGRPWPLPEPLRFYGFPPEVVGHYQNAAFTADLVLALENLFKGIFYVGPLREYPKRLYLWAGEVPDHVGAKGDRAIEAVLASRSRYFNFHHKQKTKPLAQVVAERLQAMNLIQEFEIKPLGPHRKEYEVLVRTNSKLPPVKLTDVGFGVSQVLPVIVECFYVPARSVVIFEQPEIHLHPRVQADLADLFVDAISAREYGAPRGCQFIVESHSEHFLRRLQRKIAEKYLSKDDAALYFVDTSGDRASIRELDLDLFGNIANWPDGFFGDEMADVVARSEAQAKRMSQGETGE